MASVKDLNLTITADLRWKNGGIITGDQWNRMLDAIEQVNQKHETPSGVIATVAATGMALAASTRRLTRRSLLGLGGLRG